jgi:hypothetical protein
MLENFHMGFERICDRNSVDSLSSEDFDQHEGQCNIQGLTDVIIQVEGCSLVIPPLKQLAH